MVTTPITIRKQVQTPVGTPVEAYKLATRRLHKTGRHLGKTISDETGWNTRRPLASLLRYNGWDGGYGENGGENGGELIALDSV